MGTTRHDLLPRGRTLALCGAVVAALALAGTAAADKEKIHLTKSGQAAARAAVLARSDLGPVSGWTGGTTKPDLSVSVPCTSYDPKQSDLVLNGAAKSVWKHAGLELESEAQVLQSPAMVRLDWQRTVLAPQMLPCLRSALVKSLGASGKLVSFGRTAFPSLAAYARRYRALVDVPTATGPVRVMVDIVLLGRGRTEITLSTTAPFAAESAIEPAELQLARTLAGRIRM